MEPPCRTIEDEEDPALAEIRPGFDAEAFYSFLAERFEVHFVPSRRNHLRSVVEVGEEGEGRKNLLRIARPIYRFTPIAIDLVLEFRPFLGDGGYFFLRQLVS